VTEACLAAGAGMKNYMIVKQKVADLDDARQSAHRQN
jgi:hypothetical protein